MGAANSLPLLPLPSVTTTLAPPSPALRLMTSDADLTKEILAPGGMISVGALLSETLARAFYYQGCAAATFRLFSDAPLPRLP